MCVHACLLFMAHNNFGAETNKTSAEEWHTQMLGGKEDFIFTKLSNFLCLTKLRSLFHFADSCTDFIYQGSTKYASYSYIFELLKAP